MEAKPSGEYIVEYRKHDTLCKNERYIEAFTPIFVKATAKILAKRNLKITNK